MPVRLFTIMIVISSSIIPSSVIPSSVIPLTISISVSIIGVGWIQIGLIGNSELIMAMMDVRTLTLERGILTVLFKGASPHSITIELPHQQVHFVDEPFAVIPDGCWRLILWSKVILRMFFRANFCIESLCVEIQEYLSLRFEMSERVDNNDLMDALLFYRLLDMGCSSCIGDIEKMSRKMWLSNDI